MHRVSSFFDGELDEFHGDCDVSLNLMRGKYNACGLVRSTSVVLMIMSMFYIASEDGVCHNWGPA